VTLVTFTVAANTISHRNILREERFIWAHSFSPWLLVPMHLDRTSWCQEHVAERGVSLPHSRKAVEGATRRF
jgi:hypothetical protein